MAIRDIIGLILSIFVAGVMIWACSFDIQQIMIGELVTAAGGKYQFLTILNLVTKVYNVMFIFILNLASTSDLL
jgi:hypothetical protein